MPSWVWEQEGPGPPRTKVTRASVHQWIVSGEGFWLQRTQLPPPLPFPSPSPLLLLQKLPLNSCTLPRCRARKLRNQRIAEWQTSLFQNFKKGSDTSPGAAKRLFVSREMRGARHHAPKAQELLRRGLSPAGPSLPVPELPPAPPASAALCPPHLHLCTHSCCHAEGTVHTLCTHSPATWPLPDSPSPFATFTSHSQLCCFPRKPCACSCLEALLWLFPLPVPLPRVLPADCSCCSRFNPTVHLSREPFSDLPI